MVYPIEKMSKGAQDNAKNYLISTGYGLDIFSIPGVNGVGITEGALHVTTEYYHPLQDQIPTVLGSDTSYEGLPVKIEKTGPIEYLSSPQQRGGGSNTVQGGVRISGASNEWGTCFGVLQGSGGKYALCSSHVIGGKNAGACKVNGQVIGTTKIDARHCGGKSFLDCAAALLNSNTASSFDVIQQRGKITPKGFKAPTVGQQIVTYGLNTKGSTQQIKTINYSTREDTGGNCSTSYSDLWLGSVRSKPGDSGASMLTPDGYYVGILTSNTGQYSWNCSAIHITSEMGLNVPGGSDQSQVSPRQQQAQRSRTRQAYQGWISIA